MSRQSGPSPASSLVERSPDPPEHSSTPLTSRGAEHGLHGLDTCHERADGPSPTNRGSPDVPRRPTNPLFCPSTPAGSGRSHGPRPSSVPGAATRFPWPGADGHSWDLMGFDGSQWILKDSTRGSGGTAGHTRPGLSHAGSSVAAWAGRKSLQDQWFDRSPTKPGVRRERRQGCGREPTQLRQPRISRWNWAGSASRSGVGVGAFG